MPKKKPKLNIKESKILQALHQEGGTMTRHEISEKTGIAYVTVKKYMKKMKEEGILVEE